MSDPTPPKRTGFDALLQRPLLETIWRRRTHRVSRGIPEIRAKSMTYRSPHKPVPLTDLEEAILIAITGHTGLTMPDRPFEDLASGNPIMAKPNLTMAGAAPRATHMPIRAVESVVRVSQITVAEAIDFAVAHKAHVISISLGGIPSISLYRALQRAIGADVIVITAAGNCVEAVVWPARYDLCIAVAGTNVSDQPWRGTCHGPDVAISAPGENVYRAHGYKFAGSAA